MSHYSIGSTVYTHKGKKVTSIVGNAEADAYITSLSTDGISKPGLVPAGFSGRPDLIANIFLDDPDKLWFICLISSKFDVFEDFNTGSRINLPND